MTAFRQLWRVPFYIMGAGALVAAIAEGGWRLVIPVAVGLLSSGLYLAWPYIEHVRDGRVVREIVRNGERRS